MTRSAIINSSIARITAYLCRLRLGHAGQRIYARETYATLGLGTCPGRVASMTNRSYSRDHRQDLSDLYKRAEDLGITAVMCSPWAGLDDLLAGASSTESAERFRPAIERFAETVIEKCH